MNANNPIGWQPEPLVLQPQNPAGYLAPQPHPGYAATVPIAYAGSAAGYRYVPLGWRTPLASVAVMLHGVSAVVTGLLQLGDLHPESTDPGDLALALGMVVSSLAYLGSFVLAVFFFCIWIHRASANVWAFGQSSASITPGWAVGSFFVPFVNLVKPFRAMKEIWFGSDPSGAAITPGILGAWWGTWLISGILWRISSELEGSHLEAAAGLLTAMAALFVVMIMRRITINQQRLVEGPNTGFGWQA